MNSISDFLETYGWILFVAGIVGIEIFAELQGSEGIPDYVDTGEQFLEENVNGYTCTNASQNNDGEYTVDCFRELSFNNTSVYNTRSFKITEYNGSAAVKAQ